MSYYKEGHNALQVNFGGVAENKDFEKADLFRSP